MPVTFYPTMQSLMQLRTSLNSIYRKWDSVLDTVVTVYNKVHFVPFALSNLIVLAIRLRVRPQRLQSDVHGRNGAEHTRAHVI